MIADSETNKVYYSNQSTYNFKVEITELKRILNKYDIRCDKLLGTKDYFCRDYMPIQMDQSNFVQFKFKPDYLLNNPELKKYVTDTNQVLRSNTFLSAFNIINSEIILDGGNIIRWKNKIIVTDKVFLDNPTINPTQLIEVISRLLEVKVIVIPRYPIDEPTGHADGLVRFIDDNTVVTICLDEEIQEWKSEFLQSLTGAGLQVISLPKPMVEDEKSWGYINFLQVAGLIIVPQLNEVNDEVVKDFFINNFTGTHIETIDATRIIEDGGVLNCLTWNIQI